MISQTARALTPDEWVLRGAPKIYPDRVVVPVVETPSDADREKLAAEFLDQTGFAIDWEGQKVTG